MNRQENIIQDKLKQEQELKKYKYSRELPKYDNSVSTRLNYFYIAFKESLFFQLIFYVGCRYSAQIVDYNQRTISYYRLKGLQGSIILMFLLQIYYRYFHTLNQQPFNDIYEVQWEEQKIQQILDLDINAYKNVEEIKQNRNQISKWEIYQEENKLKKKIDKLINRSTFKNFQFSQKILITQQNCILKT